MASINNTEYILPRPVEELPEYAQARARRTLAEKLVAAFSLSEPAAMAIADTVVDPSAVRKTIGEVDDPQVEAIPVPGGTMHGIRTQVWSRRVLPDPRNPRIGPNRRHPFAIDPGTGDESSRYRPVPEPMSRDADGQAAPELLVEIESPDHLAWASVLARDYIFAKNDWRDSIAAQGVMEAVWLVPTTYTHIDGTDPATVLTTVEGSSRTSAVHSLLEVRSADIPYQEYDQALRKHYRRLEAARLQYTASPEQIRALRCERMPALIIVGFERHAGGTTDFSTAVKSLVALRHVDPPRPWGDGPENESLADEVLDELHRRGLITRVLHSYLAGSCTKAEALAAHLSDDPVIRAAHIVRWFTTGDVAANEAIRVAVTSQSTRKKITTNLRSELATALIMRSVVFDPSKSDRIRRYLQEAFSQAVHRAAWNSTERDTDSLIKDAVREVHRAITDPSLSDAGPSSLELAVRAAYPFIISGALNDRGITDGQSDRRKPGEVIDAMRRTVVGIHQLAQAMRDFRDERPIRAVDEEGNVITRPDGSGDKIVNDTYLRGEFPAAGKARSYSAGATPAELLRNCVADFSKAMDSLSKAYEAIGDVTGLDGEPLVDADGVDARDCDAWRGTLTDINDELNIWARRFRKRHGGALPRKQHTIGEDDLDEAETSERTSAEFESEPINDGQSS